VKGYFGLGDDPGGAPDPLLGRLGSIFPVPGGVPDPLVGRLGSMCGAVIVCKAFAENDLLIVVADKLKVTARVANDTKISLFIGLFFGPFFLNLGGLTP
jgi:hypothetical protein